MQGITKSSTRARSKDKGPADSLQSNTDHFHRKMHESGCDDKGNQKKSNLSNSQKRGIEKLKKRIKNGEVVISTTDKSGKLTVSTREKLQKAR